MNIIFYLLLMNSVILTGCKHPALLSCSGDRDECLKQKMKNNIIRSNHYWKKKASLKFEEKVFVADSELLDYIKTDNLLNNIPSIPSIPENTSVISNKIKKILASLPSQIKNLVNPKLAGIILIENLGSTGYTDIVLDEKREPNLGFIYLDIGIIQSMNGNQWATWRESTAFGKSDIYKVKIEIADPQLDSNKEALEYILLHEFGHVLSIGNKIHPEIGYSIADLKNLLSYPYSNISWNIVAGKYTTKYDSNIFPDRTKILFYSNSPMLKAEEMQKIYGRLKKTNFISLYGAMSPEEDWAEAFASYVHVNVLKKPWTLKILKNGLEIERYNLCWGRKLCAKKKMIIKTILGG